MKRVKTAEFKSKLSEYLRTVRAGGEVIITDRDTPVARLIPFGPAPEQLTTRPGRGSLKKLFRTLKIAPAAPGTDSLRELVASRADDLEDLA